MVAECLPRSFTPKSDQTLITKIIKDVDLILKSKEAKEFLEIKADKIIKLSPKEAKEFKHELIKISIIICCNNSSSMTRDTITCINLAKSFYEEAEKQELFRPFSELEILQESALMRRPIF